MMGTDRLGWCLTDHHEQCPGTVTRSDNGEQLTCGCSHHETNNANNTNTQKEGKGNGRNQSN